MEITLVDFIAAAEKISTALAQKPEFLTIDELCAELKCTPATAGQMCHSKGFPAQKIGREWRIHRPSLIQWFAGKTALKK